MKNGTFSLVTVDALALGLAHIETPAEHENPSALELLCSALDADDEMSHDPALGLLLGLRREVFILCAAVDGLDDVDMRMALHSAWLKLGAALKFHTHQIRTLRAALADAQEGAREVA
jgi:hypothetical protein